MANEKSKAEQYRDERKARIAKAAKRNAKGMEKRNTAKKAASKVISIILAVVIALGAVGAILNTYGVWDRTLIIGKVGGEKLKISAAEYEYYYYSTFNQFLSQISQEMSRYGSSSYDYDTSLPPDKQTTVYTDPESGEQKSWADFLHEQTVEQIKAIKVLVNEAEKAKITLDDAEKKEIDEQIEQLRQQGKDMGQSENGRAYTLNAYIRFTMGPYNESFLRKMIEQQYTATKYQKQLLDDNAKTYDQKDIDAVYNKSKADYDFVDFLMYTFKNEPVEEKENEKEDAKAKRQEAADAATKKNADDFFAAVTNADTFYKKATEVNAKTADYDAKASTTRKMLLKSDLSSQLSEDAVNWLFNAKTKAGDKKLFKDEEAGTYTILFLTKPMYQAKTVSVRHILFSTVDTSTGAALSADEIAKAKKSANDALKKYNSGDKTEDSFAALATELTEDTGSQSNGGLYEDFQFGRMVYSFSDWAYDAKRKPGDVGIVETEFGYHVMYFVGTSENDYYDKMIRNSKSSEDTNKQLEELIEKNGVKFYLKDIGMKWANKKVIKKLSTLLQLKGNSSAY